MNISAINPSFQGKRENIDAVINMDDQKLRQIAYLQTARNFDEKKSRRTTNALFYSAPLAAGLGAAVFKNDISSKIFNKNLTGLAGRAAKGLKVAAMWTAALGAIDLLGFAKNKVAEHSPEVRKFDREHPFVSFAGMLAAGIGAISLVSWGAGKLGAKKAPKFLQNGTEKVARFINTNKQISKMKQGLLNIASKTPKSLKDIGATALSWAPTTLLLGGLFHSVSSKNAQNREFAKNYSELRERQAVLTRARMRELTAENDFFKQDAENTEDLSLAKNPLQKLPPEIREKAKALRIAKERAAENFEV